MAAGSEFVVDNDTEDSDNLPLFETITADKEEAGAACEEIRLLYHRLGYLDRNCMLPEKVQTEGGSAPVRLIKRCIGKACMFLLHPVIQTQNRINIQEANYLRELVHQLDRLTAENERLRKELAELKEKLT